LSSKRFTNSLVKESSPYLLQHAHNPVNWYPWSAEAFEKAKKEDKLVLVSIGYSACHWCHVMERESFENEEAAALMNKEFVCIKVDREERPDVDQLYMQAIQMMGSNGGWPLNCFTLPDGRPVYGGTYYPLNRWMNVLEGLSEAYRNEKQKFVEYAEKLSSGIRNAETLQLKLTEDFNPEWLPETVQKWKPLMDQVEGGPLRAPKFPLPDNYLFLLRYAALYKDEELRNHVHLTLKKMSFGGIYDQVGGGFARYSTDMDWKVPHFEKMLYDNAQLISLYSEAYRDSSNHLYKEVAEETINFCNREMLAPEGIYQSALDADSEGEEGKYYVWTLHELKSLLEEDFELAKSYYCLDTKGHWEFGNYILLRDKTDEEIALDFNIDIGELKSRVIEIKKKLLNFRRNRERPGLDDKCLISWNGLMIKALCDAYQTFGHQEYLKRAVEAADFIMNNCRDKEGGLYHTFKNGQRKIEAFLDDYATMIQACNALFVQTSDSKWLRFAESLADTCLKYYYDETDGFFFYTRKDSEELIARQKEVHDNVIPASNSLLAKAFYELGIYSGHYNYFETASLMLKKIAPLISSYGSSYSHWAQLLLMEAKGFSQVVYSEEYIHELAGLKNEYHPDRIYILWKANADAAILEGKENGIFVCRDKTCSAPVFNSSQLKDLFNA
jgi:uncharacterized protein